ncbi:MAG: helix-turn-helix transcriptional regulator [Candidatus Gastranaerophilales bacterium]|nr:helix-turn-helix transcriptional regulator [Candidatus Gastranaerophilales bacterium]
MISYEPLWETMREQGVSTYALINRHNIPVSTIHSLKHNKNITMYTLEKLCKALNCTADSVVKFVEEETDQS